MFRSLRSERQTPKRKARATMRFSRRFTPFPTPIDNACLGKHTGTMKRLDTTRRELVAAALCEGNSIRATARLTGSAYTTVLRFVEDMGWACQMYLDEHMRDLPCRRLQCDDLWAFVSAKA